MEKSESFCGREMNQKELIAEYYNRYADVYDTKHGVGLAGQVYNFKSYYEPFLRRFIPPAGGKVLELGCGTGVYTRWLRERGLEVVGMDISPEILKQAARRCPNIPFFQGDCEDPAASLNPERVADGFEAIIGINTFSYYPQKEKALLNYRKLLRRDGRFILIDMNGTCPYYPMMAWMNKNEMRQWLDQIKESNQRYLIPLLERTGYRMEGLEHFAFIPNRVNQPTVSILRPFDFLLGFIHGIRNFSMRIALAARKR